MINNANKVPTNATQTKERLYAQLAVSTGRMSRAISQTANMCEQLQVDLHAMRILAGLDAAKFMTIAAQLNPEDASEEGNQSTSSEKEKGMK